MYALTKVKEYKMNEMSILREKVRAIKRVDKLFDQITFRSVYLSI